MSFSKEAKQEICEHELRNLCCVQAACYGVACFARRFDTRGIVLYTENEFIAQWAKGNFARADIEGQVTGEEENGRPRWVFAVNNPYQAEKALALFGHTGEETALRIQAGNFTCSGCFAAFTAAAFLCSGTMVTPQKAYNMEFVSARFSLTKDFEALLGENGFLPKRTRRKGSNVLYFKSSEQIEDMLTYMGAPKAALEIMNLKVYNDFRNKANRIANCENANIDKTVAANQKAIADIQLLRQAGVLDTLAEPLQEAAHLRLKHPELSLIELAALTRPTVSKSGLSHRYRKLAVLAQQYGGNAAATTK